MNAQVGLSGRNWNGLAKLVLGLMLIFELLLVFLNIIYPEFNSVGDNVKWLAFDLVVIFVVHKMCEKSIDN